MVANMVHTMLNVDGSHMIQKLDSANYFKIAILCQIRIVLNAFRHKWSVNLHLIVTLKEIVM